MIMNKKIGIIIGVVVAVVAIVLGVVFLAPDKDASVDNPSESISQSDVVNQEESEVTDATEPEETTPIDLTAVDLSQYGLSSNYEISEPFPTTKGNYYYVCDYGAGAEDEFEEYRFFTTEDNVMYVSLGVANVESYINPYEYIFYDINNDGVEELIAHEKIHVDDFRVFTFEDDKMVFAGEIFDDHGYLYGGDGTITAVTREWCDYEGDEPSDPYVYYGTFKMAHNKMVEVNDGVCEPLNEAETSQFGTKLVFNKWIEG
jgi:hypothetical protein